MKYRVYGLRLDEDNDCNLVSVNLIVDEDPLRVIREKQVVQGWVSTLNEDEEAVVYIISQKGEVYDIDGYLVSYSYNARVEPNYE